MTLSENLPHYGADSGKRIFAGYQAWAMMRYLKRQQRISGRISRWIVPTGRLRNFVWLVGQTARLIISHAALAMPGKEVACNEQDPGGPRGMTYESEQEVRRNSVAPLLLLS